MTAPPSLCIIIPCLNAAAVLPRQLEALAHEPQDSSWEIVVVDNASTDATAAVAESFTERLPSLAVVREPTRGRHHACNAGTSHTKAPAVAFIDSDDVIEPGYVAAMIDALSNHEVVAGRLKHVTADGRPIESWGNVQTEMLSSGLGFLPYAAGGNLGGHREAFEAVGGFSDDIPFGEDIDLSWKLQLNGYSIHFDRSPTVTVRQRAGARAMFKQQRRFGTAHALLFEKYSPHGMPRRSLSEASLDWLRSLRAVPHLGDTGVRRRALRRLARNIGHIQGSLRARVFYP